MVASTISMLIASITSWFTPTILFCIANLIIATIFIASNNNKKHHPNISSSSYEQLQTNYTSSSRLAQSILEPETTLTLPPSQLIRAPSFLERVRSFKSIYSSTQPNETQQPLSHHQFVRAPSFLERVRSFKSIYSTQPEETVVVSHPGYNNNNNNNNNNTDYNNNQVIRSKSEKTSNKNKKKKKLNVEMKKSRSEMNMAGDNVDEDVDKRRPATAREKKNVYDEVVDEEVDAKAEHFISRFKQQLKLQRIESLVRYHEMINRRR